MKMMPQLATTITDPNPHLKNKSSFISQKLDGERALVLCTEDGIIGTNRSGAPRVMEPAIIEAMSLIPAGWHFDGEVIDDRLHVFDLIATSHATLTGHGYLGRWRILEKLFERITTDYGISLVPHYLINKAEIFDLMVEGNVEGVIFTNMHQPYTEGRSKNHLKYKFTKDVDVIVTDANINDRNNFALSVHDGATLVEVGKVSALTGDGPSIKIGDVVQVTILYVTDDNHLYQPVKPMLRKDKRPDECTLSQLLPFKTNRNPIQIGQQ